MLTLNELGAFLEVPRPYTREDITQLRNSIHTSQIRPSGARISTPYLAARRLRRLPVFGGGAGMRQLPDQHLPAQPRSLPRFVQQPRLPLLVGLAILLSDAGQILLSRVHVHLHSQTGRATLALRLLSYVTQQPHAPPDFGHFLT